VEVLKYAEKRKIINIFIIIVIFINEIKNTISYQKMSIYAIYELKNVILADK